MFLKRCHTRIPRNFWLEDIAHNFFYHFAYFCCYLRFLPLSHCFSYNYALGIVYIFCQFWHVDYKHKSYGVELILLYFLTGIWSRDIRYKSNLPLTEINKILKNLESKKLIKAVKSVAVSIFLFPSPKCSLYVYCSKYVSRSSCSLGYVMI